MSSRDPSVPQTATQLAAYLNAAQRLHAHKNSTNGHPSWKLAFRKTHKCGTDECFDSEEQRR